MAIDHLGYLRTVMKPWLWRLGLPIRFSARREQDIIARLVEEIPVTSRTCVDLGAGDGVTMSNTYPMFMKGWEGIAADCDAPKAGDLARVFRSCLGVRVIAEKITPHNVVTLLRSSGIAQRPGFLNIDLDSYDAFVLNAILVSVRPQLICCEINEKIPPPLRFAVRYSPEFQWDGGHCYGMSIALLEDLCIRHRYNIVELHYNNAFLVPSDISSCSRLSAAVAYERGYRGRADRLRQFPWNTDVDRALTLSPNDAAAFFENRFSRYRDHIYLSSTPVGDAFWEQEGGR